MSKPNRARAPLPEGYRFVAYITLPDGTRLYARQRGKRAFIIKVDPDNQNNPQKP